MDPEILAFCSYRSANVQQILHCFIPNFKMKYEDSENVKIGRVNTVVLNLHKIKQRSFWDTEFEAESKNTSIEQDSRQQKGVQKLPNYREV